MPEGRGSSSQKATKYYEERIKRRVLPLEVRFFVDPLRHSLTFYIYTHPYYTGTYNPSHDMRGLDTDEYVLLAVEPGT